MPAYYKAEDAEIRVYPAEEPYDASDMYVIDVLGATVSLRLVPVDRRQTVISKLKIMVEARGVFTVGINEDENVYGDEA